MLPLEAAACISVHPLSFSTDCYFAAKADSIALQDFYDHDIIKNSLSQKLLRKSACLILFLSLSTWETILMTGHQ